MKTVAIIFCCIFLASCMAAELPQPVPPVPPPTRTTIVVIEKTPDPPKQAIVTKNVAKEYQKAAQKEIPAVIAPDVTPERVRLVHVADRAARRALSRLEAQGHHPTKEALDAARNAVKQLSNTLNSSE